MTGLTSSRNRNARLFLKLDPSPANFSFIILRRILKGGRNATRFKNQPSCLGNEVTIPNNSRAFKTSKIVGGKGRTLGGGIYEGEIEIGNQSLKAAYLVDTRTISLMKARLGLWIGWDRVRSKLRWSEGVDIQDNIGTAPLFRRYELGRWQKISARLSCEVDRYRRLIMFAQYPH